MNIAAERLAAQHLTSSPFPNARAVVTALGAVQAQDYGGAKWALSQRTRGATDAEIERELTDGRILRTHVLRPTWHFVAPEDIRWMLALTAPRVMAFMAYYNRQLELTPVVYRRSNAAITEALTGGKHLMRSELRAVLERAKIGSISGQRLGHLMMQAELDALVCSGARRGKQFTYALLDERVPPAAPLERDAALLELTRRYFVTRGPASAHDFAWWSGLTVGDAKRGIQIAASELDQIKVGERTYWLSAKAPPLSKTMQPSAHLLPNYDEYFIGYKDRSALAQRIGSSKSVRLRNAFMAHVVAIDGQLVGGWKRTLEKKSAVLELELVTRVSAAEKRNLAAAARRFGEFVGSPVELRGC